MINNLYELNETINNIVNRIVSESVKNTSTGSWTMDHDDLADLISKEDYLMYFNFISTELKGRPEVLNLDNSDQKLNCVFTPQHCPNYEWREGDESVFKCSKEQWKRNFRAKPITQPLSMARMAEIGEAAINDTLENSDMAIDLLTECFGMSMEEIEQLQIDSPEEEEEFDSPSVSLDTMIEGAEQKSWPEIVSGVYRDLEK